MGMNIFWRISHRLYKIPGVRWGARFFELLSFLIGANAISAQINVGMGTKFWHRGVGCVVHESVVIGENCKIFQNVTIGDKLSNKGETGGVPVIGNSVTICAGAVILGKIHIGNNAIIGANAVVLQNVSEGAVAVGVPAKEKTN